MMRFEELDWQQTPMGEISLRRRLEPTLKVDVYEVKLGDEFLMSSLFTVAEVELARLGLAATTRTDLDVVVGGLGLGCTAAAALDDPRVRSLTVLEALPAVIGWHERGLLPLGARLTRDERCTLTRADFFAHVAAGPPLESVDAVLLDIDHSPRQLLNSSHGAFYTADGLRTVKAWLRPGGVFALWSDEPPEPGFVRTVEEVFGGCTSHVVRFENPLTDGTSANTVYVAERR